MPLWKIALRSIQFRSLSSILTAFSMSLGVALIVLVIVLHGVISDSFNKGAQGYDLIVGPKGNPLDIVLSTVFYLKPTVGTVPYTYLAKFQSGEYSRLVEEAIPVSIGHHFRGATIVGTTPEFFDKLRFRGTEKYKFSEGKNIDLADDFCAVVGSQARIKTGLKLGETFQPESDQCQDHKPFKVIGFLEPTGTPNDSAVFVNIHGFYDMHGPAATTCPFCNDPNHKHEDGEHEHEHVHEAAPKTLSGILLMTRQDSANPKGKDAKPTVNERGELNLADVVQDRSYVNIDAANLPNTLDKTTDVQAVSPIREIRSLLDNIVGNVQLLLILLAVLVILVAGIGMMVSIYNSMSERKQEIAIMRALGARRFTVMAIILLESILLSLGGGILGLFLGHSLLGVLGPLVSKAAGIAVHPWSFQPTELILIPGLILLATIVGFLPSAVAYRQDVATSLAP